MIILILLLFNVVLSTNVIKEKLIRVNEWHDIPITGTDFEEALIDFHLFATCEKFSVLFKTEQEGSSRFEFSYYDVTLKKIDVQSVGNLVKIPETPKVLGSCRENNRKILRVKIRTTNDTITFKIDDQLIRRPIDSAHSSQIQILIPQSVACCLIRALFLSNADLEAYTSVSTRFVTSSNRLPSRRILEVLDDFQTFTPSPILTSSPTTTTTTTDPNKWSKFTLGKNPTVSSSTSEPKGESSWTHAVNKEWSITFVLCSIIVCTIMLFLAVFGTFTVFYLMTKPQGGKSPYSVDA